MGFLEPNASKFLNVPRSWVTINKNSNKSSGGKKAYDRLIHHNSALKNVDEINRLLRRGKKTNSTESQSFRLWTRKKKYPFVAKYLPKVTKASQHKEKTNFIKNRNLFSSPSSIRMSWGSVHEPTAILTAINYFSTKSTQIVTNKSEKKNTIKRGTVVHEVGMCVDYPDEYQQRLSQMGLFLGASPDAIIEHCNGLREVLEVKNHCPFATNMQGNSKYYILSRDILPVIPPLYIPQIMMEIFCANCTSAVFIRQTATNGACILRVKRNDEYIEKMIHWLCQFQIHFIHKNKLPELNFFWQNKEYMEFLRLTKYISETVEVVDYVHHKNVQRPNCFDEENDFVSLFLDNL